MGTVKSPVGKNVRGTMRDLRRFFPDALRGSSLRGMAERSWKDPLYRNSLTLTLCRLFNAAVIGFLFWSVAAHNYPVAAVGIGTALLSAADLLMYLAMLGFDISIIRFTPLRDPGEVFSTSLWITSAAALVLGTGFLLVVGILMPEIAMVQGFWPFFLAIVLLNSLLNIFGRTFIAHRKSHLLFLQYVVMASRVPLLYPLVFLGGLGIFFAAGISHLLAAVFSAVVALGFVRLSFGINREVIRDIFRFSSANYLSNIFTITPELVLPLLVLAILGPEAAAQYYIAFAIGSLIMAVPDAIGTSYFVEGSYGSGDPRREAIRGLLASALVLVPLIGAAILFGDLLLGFFGPAYQEAYPLLVIFAVSSLFVAFHKICIPFLNIHMRTGVIILVNGARMVLLLGLAPLVLSRYGIEGAGYAWILTYGIIAIPLVWLLGRRPEASGHGSGGGA
jgi:O-antigen/teichoic acid export membrane protein